MLSHDMAPKADRKVEMVEQKVTQLEVRASPASSAVLRHKPSLCSGKAQRAPGPDFSTTLGILLQYVRTVLER